MKTILHAAASAALLALAVSPASAEGQALPAWATVFAGEKLVAVDGSSLSLIPTGNGLTLTRLSPGGATQSTVYTLMSEKMGSIADGGDLGHVTGFFRITDIGLNAEYGDGRTEQLFANAGGGLSLSGHGAGAANCASWYPAGHVFGAAERRAAVAAYAASLGVAQTGKGKPVPVATCPAPAQTRIAQTPAAAPGLLAPTTAVAVRNSEVHAVNDTVAAVPGVTASLQPGAAKQMTAAAPAPATAVLPVAATIPASETGHGASTCLSVESDGASLGFRNHCLFNVQFVYCLQNRDDPQALCNVETRAGTVPANAFVALLSDTNIKPEDAEHDFRWVACSGSGVTAYLDRAEPPSGRCVRPNAS
ncbi:MAG TPA: hypothetical protein VGG10_16955 [Rhizomicrobium sp.]|jgi:hypothetical protein